MTYIGFFRTGLAVIAMAASAPLVASCQTGPGYYGGGGYYGDGYSSSYDDGYWGYDRSRYRDNRYRDRDDDRRRYRNRHRDDDDDRDDNRRRRATSRDYDDKTEGARRIFGLDGNNNRNRNDGDRGNRGGNDRNNDVRSLFIPQK